MTRAQAEIFKKVQEISKIHSGGERFFDLLDSEIIENASTEVLEDLFRLIPKDNFIVISGKFGKKVAEDINSGRLPKRTYFLVKGGIRSGGDVELLDARDFSGKSEFQPMKGTFMDDSIYGGATYEAIKKSFSNDLKVVDCAVIYDGCPIKKDDVRSIFRYYDHFNAKPNFKF